MAMLIECEVAGVKFAVETGISVSGVYFVFGSDDKTVDALEKHHAEVCAFMRDKNIRKEIQYVIAFAETSQYWKLNGEGNYAPPDDFADILFTVVNSKFATARQKEQARYKMMELMTQPNNGLHTNC